MAKSENLKNVMKFKRRIRGAQKKAARIGLLYLLGNLLLAALACLPLVQGTSVGALWVKNFWKPFTGFAGLKSDLAPRTLQLGVSVIYALLLLAALINILRSLACLENLFKKKASRWTGFNRNAIAMKKMGNRFSGTYFVFLSYPILIHLLSGASFTTLYYVGAILGLIIHFWGGLVGGNVSLFTIGRFPKEQPRIYGRIAPFFRNLVQLLCVGVLYYFFFKVNVIGNLFVFLTEGAMNTVFHGGKEALFGYLILPAGQLLLLVFIGVLLKHATASTEFDRDGRLGKGMKNFAIFSLWTALVAGGFFAVILALFRSVAAVSPQAGLFYIAVVAFGAFLEEILTRKLPNCKGKYSEEERELEKAQGFVSGGTIYDGYPQDKEEPAEPKRAKPEKKKHEKDEEEELSLDDYYEEPEERPRRRNREPDSYNTPAASYGYDDGYAYDGYDHTGHYYDEGYDAYNGIDYSSGYNFEDGAWVPTGPQIVVRCPRCNERLGVEDTPHLYRCPVCHCVFHIKGQSYYKQ